MSHDWFCKCGHDIYSHNSGKRCNFCKCKRYDQSIVVEPKHEHTWECLDASGKCMVTGEV